MIDIVTSTGSVYRFDEETGIITKDNIVQPSYKVEAVFSDVTNRSQPPVFSGIYFKETNQLLTRSGNIHPVSDINSVL